MAESDETSPKAALAELQRDIGFAATEKCEAYARPIIAERLRHGPGGQVMLGYLSIKIAALMEDW
jgi:hypothetical protein